MRGAPNDVGASFIGYFLFLANSRLRQGCDLSFLQGRNLIEVLEVSGCDKRCSRSLGRVVLRQAFYRYLEFLLATGKSMDEIAVNQIGKSFPIKHPWLALPGWPLADSLPMA